MFAICAKTGIMFKMRSTSFFHVSVPHIYGTSSSTYLITFLKVISKVLFFNITKKFTNLLVQLSIFLIDLLVGTYRLSSHARLEAFVIQTKLKLVGAYNKAILAEKGSNCCFFAVTACQTGEASVHAVCERKEEKNYGL